MVSAMVAAGAVMELSIVAAGVVVVLGAIWLSRGRGTPTRTRSRARPRTRSSSRSSITSGPTAGAWRGRPSPGRWWCAASSASSARSRPDVSPGGVLLAGPADLTVGDVLDVRLDLGEPVGGRGRVVRETADGCKGVAFEGLPEDDRDRLERYVRAEAAGQPG